MAVSFVPLASSSLVSYSFLPLRWPFVELSFLDPVLQSSAYVLSPIDTCLLGFRPVLHLNPRVPPPSVVSNFLPGGCGQFYVDLRHLFSRVL